MEHGSKKSCRVNRQAEKEVSDSSRELAQKYYEEEDYGRAFAHLLVVLKLTPRLKNELKPIFSNALSAWGRILEGQGRYGDLFRCFNQAFEIFPENEVALNSLGLHLFRLNHLEEARNYFESSLKINPDYLPAMRNLSNVLNLLVERWHYRMLNDNKRNESYREAIGKKIAQGFNSMLDIGTGTGLLSLFALENNATEVYACDYSAPMIKIAEKVVRANFSSDRIKLIGKLSNDIKIPEDIPERLSLVFTETLDSGLLGENILQSVIHAWEHLLLPKTETIRHRVIPHKAVLLAAPIECPQIGRKSRVFKSIPGLEKGGVLLSSIKEEPYDTEDLKRIPEGYRLLGNPSELIKFDMNDPESLKIYIDEDQGFKNIFKFKATRCGYLDAIAVWFRLHVDEEISLTSSPTDSNRDCCWDQGIFPVNRKIRLKKGRSISVQLECKEGKLSLEVMNKSEEKRLRVSERMVRYLNDRTLLSQLAQSPVPKEPSEVSFLDLTPFPYAPLTMAKTHPLRFTWLPKIPSEMEYVQNLCTENCHPETTITFLPFEAFDNLFSDTNQLFDVIFIDMFDILGEISDDCLRKLPLLKSLLKPDGVISPMSLTICCQLVDSEWIANCLEVRNSKLDQSFDLSRFINQYKVANFPDLYLTSSMFNELSEPVSVALLGHDVMSSNDPSSHRKRTTVTKDGRLNVIVYWMEYVMYGGGVGTIRRPNSYVGQGAQLLEKELTVKAGTTVDIHLKYDFGYFKFKVKDLGVT